MTSHTHTHSLSLSLTHTHSSSSMKSHSLRSLVNQAVDGIPPLSLPVRRQQLHDVQRQTARLVRLSKGCYLCLLLQLRLTAEHHAAHEHLQHTQSAPLPSDTDAHGSRDLTCFDLLSCIKRIVFPRLPEALDYR